MNLSIKRLITILLAVLIIATLSLALFACDKTEPSPSPEPEVPAPTDEVLIITNGSFKNTSGTAFPKSPSNWSGSPGSTSGTTSTPSGTDNLIAGVISTENAVYNQNKSKWGDIDNPGKIGEDDNVLMIYNKVATAYKYTNSFAVEAGKYYKVTVPVRTYIQEGKGAYIYFTGAAYGAFEAINTNNIWHNYTFYIEGSLISSENVTITVALGYGATDSGNMTKGYAFFDEIKAEVITAEAYTTASKSSSSQNYTLRVPDSGMDATSGTIQPFTPLGYSGKTGTGAGGSAPYYSTDVTKGIVDTSNWDNTFGVNPNNPVEGLGNKILMVYNKNATASGYAGNRKIRFDIGGYYELSVDVYVKLADGQSNLEHKGATLALTGTDSFKLEKLDTNGQWVRYSFFVEANQVRAKDFTLELWLGQGGKEDTDTLTKGIAFFDNVTLKTITQAKYDAEVLAKDTNPDTYPNYIASLLSTNANLVDNYNLEDIDLVTGLPEGFISETTSPTVIVGTNDVKYASIPLSALNAEEWTTELSEQYLNLEKNPKTPYNTMAPIFVINNSIPTVSGLGLNGELDIKSNLHYRMAIWLKTIDIAEGKGVDIKLVTGTGTAMTSLSSFTTINTAKYTNEYTNDYVEIVFLIQGNELLDKSARLLIEMGSGTAYDPSKFVQGSLAIANINMEQINYTEYNSTATSTYIKKYTFASSSATVTNGNFNKMDLSKTTVDANGRLVDKPGTPESWTISSSTESNVVSGIVNTDNTTLLTNLGLGTADSIFNNDGWTLPFPVNFGAPNLLMLETKPAAGEFDGLVNPIGYSSNNFTLSKTSYFLIKAYVKTENGAIASIFLTPSTDTNPNNFTEITTDGNWQEFKFVVATGRNSVTTKVELFLGNKGTDTKVSGRVFFDSISYQTIDKDQYDSLKNDDRVNALSYEIETFDNVKSSSTGMPSPNNWTGTLGNASLPSGSSNLLYGVLSNVSGVVTDFGVKDAEGNIIEDSKINNDEIRDIIFNNTNTTIGDNVLVINNIVPTAYAYKTTSAETLLKQSYYEVSVWVFTHYIPEGKNARVMLSIGEDTFTFKEVNTTTYVDGEPTIGEWTKYTYYVKSAQTANTPSVYLTLGLGRYLASDTDKNLLVSGYAFFDNVNITTITEEDFNTQNAAFTAAKAEGATNEQKAFLKNNIVILVDEPESSTPSDPTDEDPTEQPKPDTFPWMLITYISSAVIGGMIIIVVIVVFFKKVYPKIAARRKTRFKKTSYDRTTSKDKTTTKSNRYDKYKE